MANQSEAHTDVVELCTLLQCLGFSVKSLDYSDGNISQSKTAVRTVVINCQTSGLHVLLETPSVNCSCPALREQQSSGSMQVSAVSGGQQLEEFGGNILDSLSIVHRERRTRGLLKMISCIKLWNETDPGNLKEECMSASVVELKTSGKIHFDQKAETPTRYRSLDTLTSTKAAGQQLPTPGPLLQRAPHLSESEGVDSNTHKPTNRKVMCVRGDTFRMPTLPPGDSLRQRNKTSSPIYPSSTPQVSMLDQLVAAKKLTEDLGNMISSAMNKCSEDKDCSSLSSMALDVSKISVDKGAECVKPQYASSSNLSGILHDGSTKRLKRFESFSTSSLPVKAEAVRKVSSFKWISQQTFQKKEIPSITKENTKTQDSKNKLKNLFKSASVPPILTCKDHAPPELSPILGNSSRNKYSHIKSTIPRPTKK